MPQHRPAPWTLTARWVFPVAAPPLERGIVTIDGERLLAVEPRGSRNPDLDLGNTAVLPGLVNAHTHLDLTGLRGRCPPTPDFTGWLRAVIRHRRSQTVEQVRAHVRTGLEESVHFGTTLLGDIAAGGSSWDAVSAAPLWAVVYYELLGLPHPQALRAMAEGRNWLSAHPPTATCRPGWSPHAPYSAAVFVFENAGLGYGRSRPPLAVHLAETLAERQLLAEHTGPFVDFLKELGVWAPEQLVRDWQDAIKLVEAADPVVLVHANYLSPDTPLPACATVVYCPRTHAAFGHPPHPFRDFLARGVRVALGTDSLASNPDLDVLAEARFLHARYPDLAGAALLRMATLSGAEALGWGQETGSLEAGKSADLIVLPLPSEDRPDPHRLIWESSSPVRAVLWRGRWLTGDRALPRRGREGSS